MKVRLPKKVGAMLLAVLAVGGCTVEQRVDRDPEAVDPSPLREVVDVPGVPRLAVFSAAVRAGDVVYLSGQIGAPPGEEVRLVGGGVRAETRQALENLRTTVEAAGGSMRDMVKCTVFLADMDDYEAMNEVYLQFFPSDPPARSTLGVSGLAFDASVEIECVAVVPEGR